MGQKLQYYTWEDFERDIPKLIALIRAAEKDRLPGFEGIFTIPRGGLPLAVKLSHELNIPIVLGGVTKNILVVDDIADTGQTLLPYKHRGVIIATLFYHKQSIVVPNIWLHEKTPDTDLIVFPWERDPA